MYSSLTLSSAAHTAGHIDMKAYLYREITCTLRHFQEAVCCGWFEKTRISCAPLRAAMRNFLFALSAEGGTAGYCTLFEKSLLDSHFNICLCSLWKAASMIYFHFSACGFQPSDFCYKSLDLIACKFSNLHLLVFWPKAAHGDGNHQRKCPISTISNWFLPSSSCGKSGHSKFEHCKNNLTHTVFALW